VKEPRDILADRIEKWAGDWHVYDYADRLLADLDAAGFQVIGSGTEGDESTAEDYHDPEGEMGVECWIGEALAEYREYDGIHRWVDPSGVAREVRYYIPANVVNALAPELVLLGRADALGLVSEQVHGAAPVYAWVSPASEVAQ
jgi:hypothetical protein